MSKVKSVIADISHGVAKRGYFMSIFGETMFVFRSISKTQAELIRVATELDRGVLPEVQ